MYKDLTGSKKQEVQKKKPTTLKPYWLKTLYKITRKCQSLEAKSK